MISRRWLRTFDWTLDNLAWLLWLINGIAWGILVGHFTDLESGVECTIGVTLFGLCFWGLCRHSDL